MAQKFNIVAQLQLQGPVNVQKVARDIQRQLSNVTATVDVKMNQAAVRNLQQTSKQLSAVSTASKQAATNTQQFTKSSRASSQAASSSAKSYKEAATAAQNFGQQSALAVKRFAAFSVGAGIIGGFVAALKKGTQSAIEFEREMIKVSQVTGQTMSSLSGLQSEITSLSSGLGVASSELLNITRILSQTGMRAQEVKIALKSLAQSSLAPTFKDMTNTAEGAIAIMAQFGVSADGLGKKLGSINALAGQFAVESQDLVFAIRRAGGAFQAAGGQLEELLALFTSVRATTRESAETIATGFRTIFTRMQRPKTVEFLKQYGVELHNLQGQFVGPFEAVKRLNKALSSLESTDPRFSKIVEELGGFRQVSKVIPLIQQFGTAQKALGVAMQGQDSLAKDAAKAQQSLLVQMVKVREQFLGFMRDVTSSDAFGGLAKGALNMVSSLIKVGEAIKPILPLIAGLAAVKTLQFGVQFARGFGGGVREGGGARGLGQRISGGKPSGTLDSANALKQTQALLSNTQSIQKLTSTITQLNNQVTKLSAVMAKPGGLKFATGGIVPGVGNRDTVPAMLTPGEFVIRKDSVEKYGAQNLAKMNAGGVVHSGRKNYGIKAGDVSRSRRLGGGAKGQRYADSRKERFGKRMSGGAGKAYAFDFDDTLAVSDAVVKEGASDPFEDFRGKRGASFVRSAKATKIAGMARTRASRGHDIYVVTARPGDKSTRSSIGHFMRGIGAPAKDIIGVGGTPGPGDTSQKKAEVLKKLRAQYKNITFLDDDQNNILAAEQIKGVKAITAKKARGGKIQRLAQGGRIEDAFYNKPGFTQDQGKGAQYQKEWDLSFGISQMQFQKATKGRKVGHNPSWKRDMAAIKQQHKARMLRVERDPPPGGQSVDQMVSPALIRELQEFRKKGGMFGGPKTEKDKPGGKMVGGRKVGKMAMGGIVQMLAGGGQITDAFYEKVDYTQDQGKGAQYQKEFDLSFGLFQMYKQKATRGRKQGKNLNWKRDMAAAEQQHKARMLKIDRDPPWEGGDSVEQMVSPGLLRELAEYRRTGGAFSGPKTEKDKPGGRMLHGRRIGKMAMGGIVKMARGGGVGVSSPSKPGSNKHLEYEKGRQKRAGDQQYRKQLYKPQVTGRFPGPELSMALMGMQINEIERLTDYKQYTPAQRVEQLNYEGRMHKGRIAQLKLLPEGPEKGAAFKKMVSSPQYVKLKKYIAGAGQKWPEGYATGGRVSHTEFERGGLKREKTANYRRQLYQPQVTGRAPGPELSMALMGMQINEIEKLTDLRKYTPEQRTEQLQYETRRHKGRIAQLKRLPEGPEKGAAFKTMVPSILYDKLKKEVARAGQQWPEGYAAGGKVSSGRNFYGKPPSSLQSSGRKFTLVAGKKDSQGNPIYHNEEVGNLSGGTVASMMAGPEAAKTLVRGEKQRLPIRGFPGGERISIKPNAGIGGLHLLSKDDYVDPDSGGARSDIAIDAPAKDFDITNKAFISSWIKEAERVLGKNEITKSQRDANKLKGKMLVGNYTSYGPSPEALNDEVSEAIDAASVKAADIGLDTAMTSLRKSLASSSIKNLPDNTSKAREGIKTDQGIQRSLQGYIFEGVTSSISGAAVGGEQVRMDLPKIEPGQAANLAEVFGPGAASLSMAEVKRSLEKMRKALPEKVPGEFNQRDSKEGREAVGSVKTPDVGEKAKAAKQQNPIKLASGGGISGSDTVPALLTPGEFVINKKSAERIGYGNLNKINKGQAKGYASGGTVGATKVQKFQGGGGVMGAMGGAMGTLYMFDALSQSLGFANDEVDSWSSKLMTMAGTFMTLNMTIGSLGLTEKFKGLGDTLTNFAKVGTDYDTKRNAAKAKALPIAAPTVAEQRSMKYGKHAKKLGKFTNSIGAAIGPLSMMASAVVAYAQSIKAAAQEQKTAALEAMKNAKDQAAINKGMQDYIAGAKMEQGATYGQYSAIGAGVGGYGVGTVGKDLGVLKIIAKFVKPIPKVGKILSLILDKANKYLPWLAAFGSAAIGWFGGKAVGESREVDVSEALDARRSGEVNILIKKMDETFKNIKDRGGQTTGRVKTLADSGVELSEKARLTPNQEQSDQFNAQLTRLLPQFQAQVDVLAQGSDSIGDFESKLGGEGKRLAQVVAEIRGIPWSEYRKELEESINNAKKLRDASDAQKAELASRKNLVSEMDMFTDAMKRASDAVDTYSGRIGASAAMGMGGPVEAKFGGSAITGNFLGRAAEGERVDPEQLEKAIQITGSSEEVKTAARSQAKMNQELPGILDEVARDTGDDRLMKVRLEERLNLEFPDSPELVDGIVGAFTTDVGKAGRSQESAIGEIATDPKEYADRLVGDGGKELLDRMQALGEQIIETQEKLLELMQTRNQMEQKLIERNQKVRTARNTLEDFRRNNSNALGRGRGGDMTIAQIQSRDLDRQQVAMGRGTPNDMSATAGDTRATADRLRDINMQREATRQQIEAAEKSGKSMTELSAKMTDLNAEAANLENGLEAAADSAEAFSELQSKLEKATAEREFRKNTLTDRVVFGDEESQMGYMKDILGSRHLAAGGRVQDMDPKDRAGTLSMLRGFGDGGKTALGGKTGNQVINETNERFFKELYATGNRDSEGDMTYKNPYTGEILDEETFEQMVKELNVASRDEKQIMTAQETLLKRSAAAEEEMRDILKDELSVVDDQLRHLMAQMVVEQQRANAEIGERTAERKESTAQKEFNKAKAAKEGEELLRKGTKKAADDKKGVNTTESLVEQRVEPLSTGTKTAGKMEVDESKAMARRKYLASEQSTADAEELRKQREKMGDEHKGVIAEGDKRGRGEGGKNIYGQMEGKNLETDKMEIRDVSKYKEKIDAATTSGTASDERVKSVMDQIQKDLKDEFGDSMSDSEREATSRRIYDTIKEGKGETGVDKIIAEQVKKNAADYTAAKKAFLETKKQLQALGFSDAEIRNFEKNAESFKKIQKAAKDMADASSDDITSNYNEKQDSLTAATKATTEATEKLTTVEEALKKAREYGETAGQDRREEQAQTRHEDALARWEACTAAGGSEESCGSKPERLASGGHFGHGSGSPAGSLSRGSDTRMAVLTPGEFVVNKAATSQNRGLLESINSGRQYARTGGEIEYLAGGGGGKYGMGAQFHHRQENSAAYSATAKEQEAKRAAEAAKIEQNNLNDYLEMMRHPGYDEYQKRKPLEKQIKEKKMKVMAGEQGPGYFDTSKLKGDVSSLEKQLKSLDKIAAPFDGESWNSQLARSFDEQRNESAFMKWFRGEDFWIDFLQGTLDVAGFIPLVGNLFDLVNAGISAGRGNNNEAGIRLAAAIPGFGLLAGGLAVTKIAKFGKAIKKGFGHEIVEGSIKHGQKKAATEAAKHSSLPHVAMDNLRLKGSVGSSGKAMADATEKVVASEAVEGSKGALRKWGGWATGALFNPLHAIGAEKLVFEGVAPKLLGGGKVWRGTAATPGFKKLTGALDKLPPWGRGMIYEFLGLPGVTDIPGLFMGGEEDAKTDVNDNQGDGIQTNVKPHKSKSGLAPDVDSSQQHNSNPDVVNDTSAAGQLREIGDKPLTPQEIAAEDHDDLRHGGFIKRARGGHVPGTGTGDSVRAMLTPGEFVINKSAAASIGRSNLQRLNKGGPVYLRTGSQPTTMGHGNIPDFEEDIGGNVGVMTPQSSAAQRWRGAEAWLQSQQQYVYNPADPGQNQFEDLQGHINRANANRANDRSNMRHFGGRPGTANDSGRTPSVTGRGTGSVSPAEASGSGVIRELRVIQQILQSCCVGGAGGVAGTRGGRGGVGGRIPTEGGAPQEQELIQEDFLSQLEAAASSLSPTTMIGSLIGRIDWSAMIGKLMKGDVLGMGKEALKTLGSFGKDLLNFGKNMLPAGVAEMAGGLGKTISDMFGSLFGGEEKEEPTKEDKKKPEKKRPSEETSSPTADSDESGVSINIPGIGSIEIPFPDIPIPTPLPSDTPMAGDDSDLEVRLPADGGPGQLGQRHRRPEARPDASTAQEDFMGNNIQGIIHSIMSGTQELFEGVFGGAAGDAVGANVLSGGSGGNDVLTRLSAILESPEMLVGGANTMGVGAIMSGAGSAATMSNVNEYVNRNIDATGGTFGNVSGAGQPMQQVQDVTPIKQAVEFGMRDATIYGFEESTNFLRLIYECLCGTIAAGFVGQTGVGGGVVGIPGQTIPGQTIPEQTVSDTIFRDDPNAKPFDELVEQGMQIPQVELPPELMPTPGIPEVILPPEMDPKKKKPSEIPEGMELPEVILPPEMDPPKKKKPSEIPEGMELPEVILPPEMEENKGKNNIGWDYGQGIPKVKTPVEMPKEAGGGSYTDPSQAYEEAFPDPVPKKKKNIGWDYGRGASNSSGMGNFARLGASDGIDAPHEVQAKADADNLEREVRPTSYSAGRPIVDQYYDPNKDYLEEKPPEEPDMSVEPPRVIPNPEIKPDTSISPTIGGTEEENAERERERKEKSDRIREKIRAAIESLRVRPPTKGGRSPGGRRTILPGEHKNLPPVIFGKDREPTFETDPTLPRRRPGGILPGTMGMPGGGGHRRLPGRIPTGGGRVTRGGYIAQIAGDVSSLLGCVCGIVGGGGGGIGTTTGGIFEYPTETSTDGTISPDSMIPKMPDMLTSLFGFSDRLTGWLDSIRDMFSPSEGLESTSGTTTTTSTSGTVQNAREQAIAKEEARRAESTSRHQAGGGGIDYSHPVQQARFAGARERRVERATEKIGNLQSAGIDTSYMSSREVSRKHKGMNDKRKREQKVDVGEQDTSEANRMMDEMTDSTGQMYKRNPEIKAKHRKKLEQKIAQLRSSGVDTEGMSAKDLRKKYGEFDSQRRDDWFREQGGGQQTTSSTSQTQVEETQTGSLSNIGQGISNISGIASSIIPGPLGGLIGTAGGLVGGAMQGTPEKIGEGAGWLSDKVKGGKDWLKDKFEPTPENIFGQTGGDVSVSRSTSGTRRTGTPFIGGAGGVGMTRGTHLTQIASDVSSLLACVCGIAGGAGVAIGATTGGIFEQQPEVVGPIRSETGKDKKGFDIMKPLFDLSGRITSWLDSIRNVFAPTETSEQTTGRTTTTTSGETSTTTSRTMSAREEASAKEEARRAESTAKHQAGGGGIDYSHPVQQARFAGARERRVERSAEKIGHLRNAGVDTSYMSSKEVSRKYKGMDDSRKREQKVDVSEEDTSEANRMMDEMTDSTGQMYKRNPEIKAKHRKKLEQKIAQLRSSGVDTTGMDAKELRQEYSDYDEQKRDEYFRGQGTPQEDTQQTSSTTEEQETGTGVGGAITTATNIAGSILPGPLGAIVGAAGGLLGGALGGEEDKPTTDEKPKDKDKPETSPFDLSSIGQGITTASGIASSIIPGPLGGLLGVGGGLLGGAMEGTPEKIGEGAGWISDTMKGATGWLKDKLQPETPGNIFGTTEDDTNMQGSVPGIRTTFSPGAGVGMTRGSHLAQIANDVSALLGCVCGISGGFIGGGGGGVTGGIFESQTTSDPLSDIIPTDDKRPGAKDGGTFDIMKPIFDISGTITSWLDSVRNMFGAGEITETGETSTSASTTTATTSGPFSISRGAREEAAAKEESRRAESTARHQAGGGGIDYSHPVQQSRFADAREKRIERSSGKIQHLQNAGVDTSYMSHREVSRKYKGMDDKRKREQKVDVSEQDTTEANRMLDDMTDSTGQMYKRNPEMKAKHRKKLEQKLAQLRESGVDTAGMSAQDARSKYGELDEQKRHEYFSGQGTTQEEQSIQQTSSTTDEEGIDVGGLITTGANIASNIPGPLGAMLGIGGGLLGSALGGGAEDKPEDKPESGPLAGIGQGISTASGIAGSLVPGPLGGLLGTAGGLLGGAMQGAPEQIGEGAGWLSDKIKSGTGWLKENMPSLEIPIPPGKEEEAEAKADVHRDKATGIGTGTVDISRPRSPLEMAHDRERGGMGGMGGGGGGMGGLVVTPGTSIRDVVIQIAADVGMMAMGMDYLAQCICGTTGTDMSAGAEGTGGGMEATTSPLAGVGQGISTIGGMAGAAIGGPLGGLISTGAGLIGGAVGQSGALSPSEDGGAIHEGPGGTMGPSAPEGAARPDSILSLVQQIAQHTASLQQCVCPAIASVMGKIGATTTPEGGMGIPGPGGHLPGGPGAPAALPDLQPMQNLAEALGTFNNVDFSGLTSAAEQLSKMTSFAGALTTFAESVSQGMKHEHTVTLKADPIKVEGLEGINQAIQDGITKMVGSDIQQKMEKWDNTADKVNKAP